MFIPAAAVLRAVVPEYPEHPNPMFVEERQYAVIKEVGCGQGCAVRIAFGKSNV
jgi:hypothetical protein